VLKDIAGVEPPAPSRRTIDMEGRVIKDAVRKTLQERQIALTDLFDAIREYRSCLRFGFCTPGFSQATS
jgi:hypothetical protein